MKKRNKKYKKTNKEILKAFFNVDNNIIVIKYANLEDMFISFGVKL